MRAAGCRRAAWASRVRAASAPPCVPLPHCSLPRPPAGTGAVCWRSLCATAWWRRLRQRTASPSCGMLGLATSWCVRGLITNPHRVKGWGVGSALLRLAFLTPLHTHAHAPASSHTPPYTHHPHTTYSHLHPPTQVALEGHTVAVRWASFSDDGTLLHPHRHTHTLHTPHPRRARWSGTPWRAPTPLHTRTCTHTFTPSPPTHSTPTQGALEGHTVAVRGASFSDDGTRLVTASPNRLIHVWDLATRQIVGTIPGE